jgi:hypothetical protein
MSADFTVATPDLSHTCIQFEGLVQGVACRVLLDNGATANFVSEEFMHALVLPTMLLNSLLTVNLVDGRAKVTDQVCAVDLSVGSFQFRVDCLPTELHDYDVVLGMPWLTAFNPSISWRLNTICLVDGESTHVLIGSQCSDVPKYVISALELDRCASDLTELYVLKVETCTRGF